MPITYDANRANKVFEEFRKGMTKPRAEATPPKRVPQNTRADNLKNANNVLEELLKIIKDG